MTTDTPDRDELKDFPCCTCIGMCNEKCASSMDAHPVFSCRHLDAHRAHIKLRADMRKLRAAVLVGSLTAHMSAEVYRGVAISLNRHGCDGTAAHFNDLARVVAKLGNP